MTETIHGDGFTLTTGSAAEKLYEIIWYNGPRSSKESSWGVAAGIGVYLSDPEIIKRRSRRPSPADVEAFIASVREGWETPSSQHEQSLGEAALRGETTNEDKS